MPSANRTPSQLRNMFGANLRNLSEQYNSISALARDLGINRTQFNRYLNGESFPRPDVLARMCDFFEVDARVLLEPVDQISRHAGPISGNFLAEFMGDAVQTVPEEMFPSGFYHFSRRSFVRDAQFVRGLVHVRREDSNTYVRGFEPRSAMAMQGIPPAPSAREYRGYVLQIEDGVSLTVSRRNSLSASMNYLNRVTSFENNYWVGYVARTVREVSSSTRMTRLVYEHIGEDFPRAMKIGRTSGFCEFEDLVPFHQRLLQPEDPFR
ncbi:MAG: helix-turn-helix transcriptional regulator [Roseobacter sp.]